MSRKPRSVKQIQARLAAQMRAEGQSWADIGAEIRRRWNVNARVALRQARGWTQPEAAEAWNRRWPEDPKSFKNFSYWEAWPSATGYAPSLEVLDRMAQLYECSIADLVSDFDDYGAKDPQGEKKAPEALPPARPAHSAHSAYPPASAQPAHSAASAAAARRARPGPPRGRSPSTPRSCSPASRAPPAWSCPGP